MTNQITLEEALELVEFELCDGGWRVKNVKRSVWGDVCGDVWGDVCVDVWGDVCGNVRRDVQGSVWGDVHGNVHGNIWGDVGSDVRGNVCGSVHGAIRGRKWRFVETPREKFKRLIEEGADKAQLLEALGQVEALPDD